MLNISIVEYYKVHMNLTMINVKKSEYIQKDCQNGCFRDKLIAGQYYKSMT